MVTMFVINGWDQDDVGLKVRVCKPSGHQHFCISVARRCCSILLLVEAQLLSMFGENITCRSSSRLFCLVLFAASVVLIM